MKKSSLFEPLSIGNLHLKNRIALAPMTRGRAGSERVPNDLMAEFYYQRSNAGLLITEATVVSKQGSHKCQGSRFFRCGSTRCQWVFDQSIP